MKFKFDFKFNLDDKGMVPKFKKVLWLSMLKMQELAIQKCPVDTGRLRSSIILEPVSEGYDEYILADGVEYGAGVEYGTRPHPVSPEDLRGWARRKFGDESIAFAVAKKIAKYGTRPQPFFRPALDEVKKIHLPRFFKFVFS